MYDDKSKIQSCIDHIKSSIDIDPWVAELAVKALEQMKAQEPRVMTLDEVRRHDGAVYLARDDGTGDWAICCDEATETLTFVHGSLRGHIDSYKKDVYSTRWRCLTSRPTDEQREAVKWNA